MASAQPRLQLAAALGDETTIKQYIAAGDDVNARDADGRTALFKTVLGDHTECVKILLAAGADPSLSDNNKFFPLHVAAQNTNIAIAKALIRFNADINAICDGPGGGTALAIAASKGDQAMLKLLLDAGCDTSKTGVDGQHPLTDAALEGHADLVTLLLDAGADVNAVDADVGYTALIAGAKKGSLDVITKLLEGGADVNQPSAKDRRTALHLAALYGHPRCAYALLCAGANVSATNDDGASPLHLAAYKGFTDVIEVLLSAGAQADVNLEDFKNRTPLALASNLADVKAVNLLLDAGADINQQDATGHTALFGVSDAKIVKALLDRGANVSVLDKLGWTVLHGAAYEGEGTALICAMYKGGADPTVKAITGETAADVARSKGHEDAAKLLDLLAAKHRSMNST